MLFDFITPLDIKYKKMKFIYYYNKLLLLQTCPNFQKN